MEEKIECLSKRKAREALRLALAQRFPILAAPPAGEMCKVLAVGIFGELEAACPDIPEKDLQWFFAKHCCRLAYLEALVANEHRFHLDGSPAGLICAEHKVSAQEKLDARNARKSERKARLAARRAATQKKQQEADRLAAEKAKKLKKQQQEAADRLAAKVSQPESVQPNKSQPRPAVKVIVKKARKFQYPNLSDSFVNHPAQEKSA